MRRIALGTLTLTAAILGGCAGSTTLDKREADDVRFCELHHTDLVTRKVPIAYGLMRFRAGERAARESGFPNACTSTRGGCYVLDARFVLVYSCPQCEKAEKVWIDAHENGPWLERPD